MGIIDYLRMFNRKERFFFIGMALGNPDFTLSGEFRHELLQTLHIEVPGDAFSAMDYHLDWIYGSLFLSSNDNSDQIHSDPDKHIKGTLEDTDLLVSYEDANKACHILMLEAKFVLAWSNAQLNSKADRLKDIFGEDGRNWKGVIPHFAIVSPKKPSKLKPSRWPEWMKPNGEIPWMKLSMPNRLLKKTTRCDESGRPSSNDYYWKIESSKIGGGKQEEVR